MTYDPAIKENLIRTENQGYAAGFTSGVKIATALGREIVGIGNDKNKKIACSEGNSEIYARLFLYHVLRQCFTVIFQKGRLAVMSRRHQKILEKVLAICNDLSLEPDNEESLRSLEFLRKLMKQVLPQEQLPQVGITEAMNF